MYLWTITNKIIHGQLVFLVALSDLNEFIIRKLGGKVELDEMYFLYHVHISNGIIRKKLILW